MRPTSSLAVLSLANKNGHVRSTVCIQCEQTQSWKPERPKTCANRVFPTQCYRTYKKSFESGARCCCSACPPQRVAGATNRRQNSAPAAPDSAAVDDTSEALPSHAYPLSKKSLTSCESDSRTLAKTTINKQQHKQV